ncbi:putative zinc-type alcohol dehydrogenase-like protein [Microcella putealis]|uniref:alcohol dehydrogenase (NADP(+)) n=1 Tax=Microcella putealis TaxID=337005 RepID=A0A4Q7LP55_9MICO|nr:NAD(P)-dependent alcohol dehydrogenase [Microcella putealis]RZS56344.1 putative zinc-type alcohol dehydrogenase-like protein [Microcella putealis]TQM27170.1 putative zinc-type alcohol dehydrogenase-like protein [Microcella putealis]
MAHVPAIVAPSADAPLEIGTVDRRAVGAHDVRIAIDWAGICHSDIHTVRGDWGPQHYPLTVGHEIAGHVVEVGDAVTRFSVGDRVGVGCMVNSCGECENCRAGEEQYCERGNTGTYGAVDRDGTITQGGYSTEIVVTESFVLRVPESLPYERVAPLLCAGITTYSPLRHWKAGPGSRVAVIGLGGLGHMAVKQAVAMGAEVTVLSQSLSKRDDGLAMGARDYFATSDPATFETLARSFDLIINTVSAPLDLAQYFGLLTLNGTFVSVGAPPEPMPVQVFSLFMNRRSFAGSSIGGIRETQEMLDFCAEHDVAPDVEVITAQQVNEAWNRVLRSDVRYRFVIDVASLREQAAPTA